MMFTSEKSLASAEMHPGRNVWEKQGAKSSGQKRANKLAMVELGKGTRWWTLFLEYGQIYDNYGVQKSKFVQKKIDYSLQPRGNP